MSSGNRVKSPEEEYFSLCARVLTIGSESGGQRVLSWYFALSPKARDKLIEEGIPSGAVERQPKVLSPDAIIALLGRLGGEGKLTPSHLSWLVRQEVEVLNQYLRTMLF